MKHNLLHLFRIQFHWIRRHWKGFLCNEWYSIISLLPSPRWRQYPYRSIRWKRMHFAETSAEYFIRQGIVETNILLSFMRILQLSTCIHVSMTTRIKLSTLLITGGRFKNTYELLNLRGLKISKLHKNHIFQCMGKIFCVEFQRVPLKFHTKYHTHTLKDVDFIHIWKFKSS